MMQNLMKNLLLVTALTVCMIIVVEDKEQCKGCPKDEDSNKDSFSLQLKSARVKRIKRKILDQLRMSHPPKVSRASIPSIILERDIFENQDDEGAKYEKGRDDYHTTTENKVVFPEVDVACNCPTESKQSTCLCFKSLQHDTLKQPINSVHLWTYHNGQHSSNLPFFYRLQENEDRIERSRMMLKETSEESGWHKTDITDVLSTWPKDNLMLEFVCNQCGSELVANNSDKRPFITINMNVSKTLKRIKRSKPRDCRNDYSTCCREMFYLNFTELAWDEWILFPKGYWANYCIGSCLHDVPLRFGHSFVKQSFLNLTRKSKFNKPLFSVCCAPFKLSAISLIYISTTGDIKKDDLEEMTVDECNCT